MTKQCKLKRAIIKEELFALTGDDLAAIILNQFLYWSERTRDFDQFIAEEKGRDPSSSMPLTHGWIYKSAEELKEEIMTSASAGTIRRRIKDLVFKGWLQERNNPIRRWDRTLQYRPDIHKIQSDLAVIGYSLEGYPLQIEDCILHSVECNEQNADCILHCVGAIPETTAKTTSEITTKQECDSVFPTTDNPLSESNMPTEPANGRRLSKKDYLEAIAEFREGQSPQRPKGWQEASAPAFEICQHVAEIWLGGIMPTGQWGDRIEKWLAGATELLRYHGGDVGATKETLSRYCEHYLEMEGGFSVAGPHSLVGVIPGFMASRARQVSATPVPHEWQRPPVEVNEAELQALLEGLK